MMTTVTTKRTAWIYL